jgi:CheY-like chemotaxis protein
VRRASTNWAERPRGGVSAGISGGQFRLPWSIAGAGELLGDPNGGAVPGYRTVPLSSSTTVRSPGLETTRAPETADRPAAGRPLENPAMPTESTVLQVLLVEDDLADVALMENAFEDHRLLSELHHVADGEQALAFLYREEPYTDAPRPDLILLDLNMPRVDGRQALTLIKQDENLRLIPVIIFTTSSTDSDIMASYTRNANAYVTKPIDLDHFEYVVAEIRNFFGHTATLPSRTSDAARLEADDAG